MRHAAGYCFSIKVKQAMRPPSKSELQHCVRSVFFGSSFRFLNFGTVYPGVNTVLAVLHADSLLLVFRDSIFFLFVSPNIVTSDTSLSWRHVADLLQTSSTCLPCSCASCFSVLSATYVLSGPCVTLSQGVCSYLELPRH